MSETVIVLLVCVTLSYCVGYLRGKQVGLAASLKAFMGTITESGALTNHVYKTLHGTLTVPDKDDK